MSFIESLLYEDESETLDFKREQYRFEYATDNEKSELLKDILAFANAWRRTDAYILIGVEEVQGGKDKVWGVSVHLDDAKLQQFVNSKTQRPVQFSYSVQKCEGKEIGVIWTAKQERPIYLKSDYGKLQKNTVYVRRGTSTDMAEPDEIARMREYDSVGEAVKPSLAVKFFDAKKGCSLGERISIVATLVDIPDLQKIPDYGPVSTPGVVCYPDFMTNKDYYRESATYIQQKTRIEPVNFAVSNSGIAVANSVRFEIRINGHKDNYIFLDEDKYPRQPSASRIGGITPISKLLSQKSDLTVKEYSDSWFIEAVFGRVQPKRTVETNCSLYVGAHHTCAIEFEGMLYADEIPDPVRIPMAIEVETREVQVDIDTLLKCGRLR